MQLNTARLCLNCEEIHDARTCPVCASEGFVFLTQWVPRMQPQRRPVLKAKTAPAVPRAVLGGGVLGLIGFGLYRWYKRAHTRIELAALRKAGELR